MKLDELMHSLKELEINLKNTNVMQVLDKEQFDFIALKKAIKIYLSNQNLITDDLANRLSQKVIDLINYTNKGDFRPYYNNFLNPANFLINYANELEFSAINRTTNDLPLDNLNLIPSITEEEFSNRYDALVSKLNIYPEESNLILETPSEKRSFKVFKNTANSLLIRAGQKQTPMTITKERFLNDAYGKNKYNYPSYEPIIISKIMDNSIFKNITSSTHNSDLTEALKNQLNKQKEELLIFRNKLENLEENEEQLTSKKEQINQILNLAQNAKKEYEDAKDAAINDTKLKTSVSYWEEKQDKHKHRFWNYGSLAITLIIILIIGLYFIISTHNITPQNTNSISTIIDLNAAQKEKNISKTTILKSNINDANQTTHNISLHNSIDFLHYFGWYALLIFASSSALWIIRITVKIALSNLHLSEDAHERVVMIKTYLAFISEGHGLEENDKQLIMTSLFRPSNIGIIKDESSITVADIVSSLKAK